MRIGIDARVLERRMTGIGRYLSGILAGIKKFDSQNEYFLFTYNELADIDDFFSVIPTSNKIHVNKLYSSYWLRFILPAKIKENKIDVFFSPNNFLPNIKSNIKTIATIHDTVHKINKNFHPLSYRLYKDLMLPRTIKKSNIIITVSENSKQDLIKYYNIDPNKVKAVHQYIDDKFDVHVEDDQHFSRVKEKYDLNNKPILYMGAIENRKNIIGILKIADIVRNKIDNEFVLIGKKGYGFKNLYEQIKMRDNVRHIEYVDEEDIQYVYKTASIFLFTSFYEGFGLPPLEAMKSGIPTLASNTSSLKEVIGSGGILFEPTQYEAFANEIMKLLNNSDYYNEVKQRGIKVAQKYNLENTAKKMVEIFNDLAY